VGGRDLRGDGPVSAAALLVGHGSPDPAARVELGELRDLVALRLCRAVGIGVLEFPAPGLPALDVAFDALAGNGGVAAQPLVLFEGLHGRHDVPAAAAAARDRLGLDVRMGAPLGPEPALVRLAAARVGAMGPGPGDVLLFVGRGSSEAAARAQAAEVAAAVAGEAGIDHVLCHAGISRPGIAEGIETALRLRPRRVLALPYLLHTGVLARRVSAMLGPIARERGVELAVLPHLGNAPALVELVAGRLEAMA
jgi:sirohydrochlorin ferrochelatase